jgi:DNA-binding NarL/FixJ family response regulator
MDVRMPELDGIEATRRIVALGDPPVRVLMLTTFDLSEYLLEALDAGVSGFTLKDTPPDELLRAVLAVAHGDALVAASMTLPLMERGARNHPPADLAGLTPPEREILDLIAAGRTNADIAEQLGASGEAVAAVIAKLGVRDRVHAALAAMRGR